MFEIHAKRSLRKKPGQALVETALLITLLFFLLSAAVDAGLIYFAYQAIANAAQEGASYGSVQPNSQNAAPPGDTYCTPTNANRECLNVENIQLRARNESLNSNLTRRVSVVNMRDLDSDRIDFLSDSDEAGRISVNVARNAYAAPGADCLPPAIDQCEIIVTVTYSYRPFFFLAPFIGLERVNMSATRQMTVRDYTVPETQP